MAKWDGRPIWDEMLTLAQKENSGKVGLHPDIYAQGLVDAGLLNITDPEHEFIIKNYPIGQWEEQINRYNEIGSYSDYTSAHKGIQGANYDYNLDQLLRAGIPYEQANVMAADYDKNVREVDYAPQQNAWDLFDAVVGGIGMGGVTGLAGGALSGATGLGTQTSNALLNAAISGDIDPTQLATSYIGDIRTGEADMGVLDDIGGFFKENPLAMDALQYGVTGNIPTSVLGNLPGNIGSTFEDNPWLANLVGGFIPQGSGDINMPSVGGGGFDLSSMLGGDFDYGDIASMLTGDTTDDFLRDYGIPIGLGYLAREESQPWENMLMDSMHGMMGSAQTYQNMFNNIFNPNWNWGDPTQAVGGTGVAPTSAGAGYGAPQGGVANVPGDVNNDGIVTEMDIAAANSNNPMIQNAIANQPNRYINEGQAYQPNIGGGVNIQGQEFAPSQQTDPYTQALQMLSYGMMNPLGSDEAQARLGQMYDAQAGNFNQLREQVKQNAAAMGQNPDPAQNPALYAEIQKINNQEQLQRQGQQRDMFTYSQDLQRDYTQDLLGAMQPILGMPGQAASIYGQMQPGIVGQQQNIADIYGGLGQALAQRNTTDGTDSLSQALDIMNQLGLGTQPTTATGATTQQTGAQTTQQPSSNAWMDVFFGGGGDTGTAGSGFAEGWSNMANQLEQQQTQQSSIAPQYGMPIPTAPTIPAATGMPIPSAPSNFQNVFATGWQDFANKVYGS